MRTDHCEMKTLPIAGSELVRICFWGNGKDSEARIEVRGAREATIPLSGAAMDLTLSWCVQRLRLSARPNVKVPMPLRPGI